MGTLEDILAIMREQLDQNKQLQQPKALKRTITVEANKQFTLSVHCNAIYLKNSTGNFQVRINAEEFSELDKGVQYKAPVGGLIHDLTFKDTSGATNNIEVYIVSGDITDASLIIDDAIKIYQGGSISDTSYSLLDKTYHKVLDSASTNHNWATLQNNNTTGNIRVGGISLANSSLLGIKLIPGAVRDFAITGDVYARADASNLSITIQYGS